MDPELAGQLERQAAWLRDSWLWLLDEKVRPIPEWKALDVGCGTGLVMEFMASRMRVTGVDADPGMVEACRSRGLDVVLADAHDLPFEDDAFDLAYCSFLLLWLDRPTDAIREMARVSSRWVMCLSEPDYGGRIDHPRGMEALGQYLIRDLKSRGADPFVGRKLRQIFADAGLDAEIGVHQGIWPPEKLLAELPQEVAWVPGPEQEKLLRAAENAGRALFQYNPVFYAIASIK